MVETNGTEGGGQTLLPPPRLYERLAQLSGYIWDQSIQPFHSVSDSQKMEDIELTIMAEDL